jgi:hypothetical protein
MIKRKQGMLQSRNTAVKMVIVTETLLKVLSCSFPITGRVKRTEMLTTKLVKVINEGRVNSMIKETIPKYDAISGVSYLVYMKMRAQEDRRARYSQ